MREFQLEGPKFVMLRFRLSSAVWLIALCFAMTGWSAVAAHQDSTPVAEPPITREVLSEAEPEAAPGQILQLSRIIIQPGAVLPIHTHPGVQMAWVLSGELTYHVISDGHSTVLRADGTAEQIGPGESTVFYPGDSLTEPEGMVHYGENLTDEVVVLIVGSLFEIGVPPSAPVTGATPVATPAA